MPLSSHLPLLGQEPLPLPLDVQVVTHRCEMQVWFAPQWLAVAHVTHR